jgi:hypothetical protein
VKAVKVLTARGQKHPPGCSLSCPGPCRETNENNFKYLPLFELDIMKMINLEAANVVLKFTATRERNSRMEEAVQ